MSAPKSLHELAGGGIGWALVQLHGDVGPQKLLDAHIFFRRPAHVRAVVHRAEGDAVIVQLSGILEREDLKAAGIGEHGAKIAGKPMHSARLRHDFGARALGEMVGVGQHYLSPERFKLGHGDAFDAKIAGKPMHSARLRHDFGARALGEMVGVGQHYLSPERFKLGHGDAFDGGRGAHRHEHGSAE